MNENDISAILPLEDQKQMHFIQGSQILMKPPIQDSIQFGSVLVSTEYPNIFFCQQSMKNLLQQRSQVCSHLKLNLKPTNKKVEPQIPLQQLYGIVGQLYKECPTPLDPLYFVFIIDCGIAYGFFSGDGKYVPMCKKCNNTVYTVIRGNVVKIVCSNSKCKIKLLGEMIIETAQKTSVKKIPKIATERSQKNSEKSKIESHSKLQMQQKQRELTKQQLNLIKKTAMKIAYP